MDYRLEQLDDEREVHLHSVSRRDMDIIQADCAAQRAAGAGNGIDGKWAMQCEGWVIWDWCARKGIDWKAFWRDQSIQIKFLDDPDNATWRIWQGRI